MNEGKNKRDSGFGQLDGTSNAMKNVYKQIMQLAPHDMPVLVTGRTGTGKEKCAEALHSYSRRHEKSFIPFNCAVHTKDMLPSALFGHVRGAFTGAFAARSGAIAQAAEGTLFLDEIGDMPMETQATLLRFTQDNSFQKLGSDKIIRANVRLICATNQNLEKQIAIGLFREDLYFRLNAGHIHMPDLNDRQNDVIDLTLTLLDEICEKQNRSTPDISRDFFELLLRYDWPGNVRELENILLTCLGQLEGDTLDATNLPEKLYRYASKKIDTVASFHPLKMPLRDIEKNAILSVIDQCGGNIVKAAAILDIAPSTIYRKKQEWKSS